MEDDGFTDLERQLFGWTTKDDDSKNNNSKQTDDAPQKTSNDEDDEEFIRDLLNDLNVPKQHPKIVIDNPSTSTNKRKNEKSENKAKVKKLKQEKSEIVSIDVSAALKRKEGVIISKETSQKLLAERIENAKLRENAPIYLEFRSTLLRAEQYNSEHYKHRMPIFAHNYTNSDKNYYILASYETVWSTMRSTKKQPQKCAFYEQLTPIRPCHAYYDIEIFTEPNKDRSLDELKSQIYLDFFEEIRLLSKKFGYIQDASEIEFLVAEASNEKKFSFHVVQIMKNKRFANLFHVGSFVRSLQIAIQEKYGVDVSKNKFFFRSRDTNHNSVDPKDFSFIADLAVYTDNRNFRMFYCSKTSGYRPLVPVDISDKNRDYRSKIPTDASQFDREIWLKSIIQRISPQELLETEGNIDMIICLDPITKQEPVSTSDTKRYRLDLNKNIVTQHTVTTNNQKNTILNIPSSTTRTNNKSSSATFSKSFFQYGKEQWENHPLFKKIAQQIERVWSGHGFDFGNDKLQVKCIGFHFNKKMAYFSSRSHFCKLKGAYHGDGKSVRGSANHVKFEACLSTFVFFQKCFSTDSTCSDNKQTIGFKYIENFADPLIEEIRRFLANESDIVQSIQANSKDAIRMLSYLETLPEDCF